MSKDNNLFEELVQSKFEDDVITSSEDRFDLIFDTVQKKKKKRDIFIWYRTGILLFLLLLSGAFILYYINQNQKTHNKIPSLQDNKKLTVIKPDSIFKKEENKIQVNKDTVKIQDHIITENNAKEPKIERKQIDVENLTAADEIPEKGVIEITYTASDKYAYTQKTKYNKLPDSSTVVVRKNSVVNYMARKQGFRQAKVTGTAFFSIEKDENKPFIIFGKNSKTQVSGNSFAIHSDIDADIITLLQGTAKVVHNTTKESKVLLPGQTFKINKKGIHYQSKSPNKFSWKTKILSYDNAHLIDIIYDLGDNFEAKIILKNKELTTCTYSGDFVQANATDVLIAVCKKFNLNLTLEDNIYSIFGKGNCNN